MTNEDETSYNTRIFPQETKYAKCEHCDGVGFIYYHDNDCNLIKEDCEYCACGLIEIN